MSTDIRLLILVVGSLLTVSVVLVLVWAETKRVSEELS